MKTANHKGNWIGIVITILIIVIIGVGVVALIPEHPNNRIDKSIYNAFSGICASVPSQAEGVDEAALFLGGPSGPIPTLLLNSEGGVYGSTEGLGTGWNPNSVSDVQLVVCIGDERSMDKDCTYTLKLIGLLGRYASVIEAKTGVEVGGFKIFSGYSCPGKDVRHEEYSPDAIRAILEDALSNGKINPPLARFFDSTDIIQDPEGKYTHIHITAHRFKNGEKLQFTNTLCSRTEAALIGGLKDYQVYYVKWVNEDTIQLASEVNSDLTDPKRARAGSGSLLRFAPPLRGAGEGAKP